MGKVRAGGGSPARLSALLDSRSSTPRAPAAAAPAGSRCPRAPPRGTSFTPATPLPLSVRSLRVQGKDWSYGCLECLEPKRGRNPDKATCLEPEERKSISIVCTLDRGLCSPLVLVHGSGHNSKPREERTALEADE